MILNIPVSLQENLVNSKNFLSIRAKVQFLKEEFLYKLYPIPLIISVGEASPIQVQVIMLLKENILCELIN